MLFSKRTVYALLFYVLVVTLIIVSKPGLMFRSEGSVKPFGLGNEKTIFSLGIFCAVMAIMCSYVFTLVDVIFERNMLNL
jgi:hypothetical protein